MRIIYGCLVLFALGFTACQTAQNSAQNINSPASESTQQEVETPRDTTYPLDHFTDPRDGERYAVVKIGDQTWMAENLRFNAPGSWLNPGNPSAAYGRLYNALIAQNICPEGWHLPSDAEWNKLEMYLGMAQLDTATSTWRGVHGTKMKSATGWTSARTDSANGTNSSGFNAFPSGYCDPDNGVAIFEGLGRSVGFWSSVENGASWQRWLGAPLEGVNRQADDILTHFASACRCVKD